MAVSALVLAYSGSPVVVAGSGGHREAKGDGGFFDGQHPRPPGAGRACARRAGPVGRHGPAPAARVQGRGRVRRHVGCRAGAEHRQLHAEPPYEGPRSEEHTSELQSLTNLVCRLLLEKKTTPKKAASNWRDTPTATSH